MVSITRKENRVGVIAMYLKRMVNLSMGICLFLSLFLTLGCNEGAMSSNDPSKRVVLFTVKGPSGDDFTKILSTELTKNKNTIIWGDDFSQPRNLLEAAKIARDNNAGTFIYGNITNSGMSGFSKYYFNATFTVHETEAGDQIGGIGNYSYSKDLHPLDSLIKGTLSIISKPAESKQETDLDAAEKSKISKCHEIIAKDVARKLYKGL